MIRDERLASEAGSVVVGVALVAVLLIFVFGIGLVGAVAAAYSSAATAADAAALASAPVTFRPFGAQGSAISEASRFASHNGATLVDCTCPTNRSWEARTVSVTVSRAIVLPVVGRVVVNATSRATFDPAALLSDP
jgi:hypothetical protein